MVTRLATIKSWIYIEDTTMCICCPASRFLWGVAFGGSEYWIGFIHSKDGRLRESTSLKTGNCLFVSCRTCRRDPGLGLMPIFSQSHRRRLPAVERSESLQKREPSCRQTRFSNSENNRPRNRYQPVCRTASK